MRKILSIGTLGLSDMILGKKKKAAPATSPATPAVMPTADDTAILRARRRSIVQQRGRKGRDSTNLTGNRLGG